MNAEQSLPEINALISKFQTHLIMDELKGGREKEVNAARDALLTAVLSIIEDRTKLRQQLTRLCDQIERGAPVDDHGHPFVMNAEYIAARAWQRSEDGNDDTDCGGTWCLDGGTPPEHGMKYCPYCGKLIAWCDYVEEHCDDEE